MADQTPRRLVLFADFTSPECRAAESRVGALGLAVVLAAWERFPVGTRVPDRGTPRTRKAHEAARFARTRGLEPAMRAALYAAHLDQGRDIGRIDVLADLGAEVGLDRTEVRVTLDIDQFTDEILREQARGRQMGVTGVPTFAFTGEAGARILTGLPSPAELAEFLQE